MANSIQTRTKLPIVVAAALWAAACSSSTDPAAVTAPPTASAQPSAIMAVRGSDQTGVVGRPLDTEIQVRVTDAAGNPLSGISVSFDPDPGSGTVRERTGQTGVFGVAGTVWTLGDAQGSQVLRVRAANLPVTTFRATAVSVGQDPDATEFDVVIRYDAASATAGQRLAFSNAARRWEEVLVGDLPDVLVQRGPGFCGSDTAISETVDDLLILATIEPIDGPGGVLGSAGPCLIRFGSDLPVLGRMRFDSEDLAQLEAGGVLEDVIIHEIGHVIGIGGLWDVFGLLRDTERADSTQPDPHFVGPRTLAAFDAVGGDTYAGSKVPVEDGGGDGTRLSHWRESVMDSELMTGFIDSGANPLSLVTIASLEDMGYVVNRDAADGYVLPGAGGSGNRVGRRGPSFELHDDILDEPIYTIDENGTIRRLQIR